MIAECVGVGGRRFERGRAGVAFVVAVSLTVPVHACATIIFDALSVCAPQLATTTSLPLLEHLHGHTPLLSNVDGL